MVVVSCLRKFGAKNSIGVRSAVGFGSLPDNIPVEIEALFELVSE
jgi:hypothetical protein